MDPSTDLPATIEPVAHIAHAANPTPSHVPIPNHPPYAEMITAAIAALKDKKGSSRRAIAKYIDKEYSNLPASHSALLTHHLKRLKNNGLLVMVKHSYKLPRSALPLPPANGDANPNPSSSGPKRGPGRPPKPKTQALPIEVGLGTESVFESLGLIDGPPTTVYKRGRGRPPKDKTGLVGVESGGVKRGRGRLPRPKLLSVVMGQGGPKRGRGRPPRFRPAVVPGSDHVPRPRGRPKKDASSKVKLPGRPRGRPPKNMVTVAAVGVDGALAPIVGGVEVLSPKQRGRPPRVGGVKKPRKLSGRPLGRPRKNASVAAIQASDPQQLMAFQELKTKLEHFQSRIKQVVSVVKPYLSSETSVPALGALQELEELATMDVSAPLNVQGQEPLLQN